MELRKTTYDICLLCKFKWYNKEKGKVCRTRLHIHTNISPIGMKLLIVECNKYKRE